MYNKSHLISFGNYLLKTYGVRYHSTDGKNTPLETRQVSHADTEGWKEQTPVDSDSNKLPSRFNFGDPVVVYFGTAGIIRNCTVIKIHFTESKVSYDVEVKWRHSESADKVSAGVDKERELTDRLYNLDSAVVLSPNDFEVEKTKFTSVQDELPPPQTPVLIKRKTSDIYLGFRINAPLSTNPDASQECRWYGNLLAGNMGIENYALQFKNNFSDVTVEGWAYLNNF